MPLILAVKIAITLEADPLAVIAEMQLERAKNPAHREFWRSFPRRAGMAAVTACTRVFGCFGFCVSGAGRAGGLTAGRCGLYFA
ncbi:MAG: hypothetical protein LBV49_08220 [Azonexus sp.]|jgi:hypothetical protein|nr:hypothetical protein [Azonexus sp.]